MNQPVGVPCPGGPGSPCVHSRQQLSERHRHRRNAARYASVSLELTSLRMPDSGDEERCPPEGFDFAGVDFSADLEYSGDGKNWTTVATLTGVLP